MEDNNRDISKITNTMVEFLVVQELAYDATVLILGWKIFVFLFQKHGSPTPWQGERGRRKERRGREKKHYYNTTDNKS